MRLSIITILTLASSALAAPTILQQRDDSVVKYNVKRIADALTNLDNALAKRPRASSDAKTLNSFLDNVLRVQGVVTRELHDGASDLRRAKGSVSATEMLTLQPTMLGNERLNNDVATKYVDIKRQVTSTRRTQDVLGSLVAAQTEFNNFSDALIVTLPSLSQSIGQSMKSKFNSNLNRAIQEYRR